MAKADDAQTTRLLRERIHSHLSQRGIFDELRQVVQQTLGADASGAMGVAAQRGAMRLVLSSIAQQSAQSQPAAPVRGSSTNLHVQLLGGRAFVDAEMRADGGALRVAMAHGACRFRSEQARLLFTFQHRLHRWSSQHADANLFTLMQMSIWMGSQSWAEVWQSE
eukprot:3057711-Pleurochrysis_carterae.AAC.1